MEEKKFTVGKTIVAYTEVRHHPQERSVPDDVFTKRLTTAKSHLPLSPKTVFFNGSVKMRFSNMGCNRTDP